MADRGQRFQSQRLVQAFAEMGDDFLDPLAVTALGGAAMHRVLRRFRPAMLGQGD